MPKKVLLVDDSLTTRMTNRTIIARRTGHDVVCAANGAEALKLVGSEHPDLVLMDVMMPGMDGYETIKELRKKEHFRKLAVIALTAKAMKGDREKCMEAGASDYIAKPVDVEKLLSLMRVWLYRGETQVN